MNSLIILITALLFVTCLKAGNLYIHNTTDQPVKFRFIPQVDNNMPQYNYDIAQNSTQHIEVNVSMFDGKSIYAIEGETQFGGDSCFNLYVNKNYKIFFKKVKFGTMCKVKEIKKGKCRKNYRKN